MRLLKALWETIKWFLCPTCDHEAGICLGGQGKQCKLKGDKK